MEEELIDNGTKAMEMYDKIFDDLDSELDKC